MAKVIGVTGGAGFIGSHLVDVLLSKGHQVIVIDNFFTGRRENLEHHAGNSRLEIIRHDVVEPLLVEVDEIYHLACPASPVHYQSNPVKTIKTNVIGTINMLGVCKRVRARFLIASTSEVYGDPLEHPQSESYWGHVNPVGPRSCYDEGKRVAESLTFNYQLSHKLDTKIVRIFNTYGPRMLFDDGRVVSNLIVQALRGKELTVYGDGSQTRSFCYVDDLVHGLIAMMESENFHGPVNLGNPDEMTVLQLAELIKSLTGSPSPIVFKPLPKDDPCRRRPDVSLAGKELGWKPTISTKEGLAKTIQNFQERLSKGEV